MLLDLYRLPVQPAPKRLESVIRNILRLGGYQILFLDKASAGRQRGRGDDPAPPPGKGGGYGQRHPAEICRQSGGYAAPARWSSPADSSLRYSHTRWLVERLLSLIGEEETDMYLRMNNQVVPINIQTNPLERVP